MGGCEASEPGSRTRNQYSLLSAESPREDGVFDSNGVKIRYEMAADVIAITPADRPKPTEEPANAIAKFLYDGKDVKAFAIAGRSFKNLEVTAEQLRACQAPMLFIHGGNESAHAKGRVATVRELIGRGEVKIVEGGNHMTTLAKPEFGTMILEFLRANMQK